MAGGFRWTPQGIEQHKKKDGDNNTGTPKPPPPPKGPTAIDFSTPEKKFASIASWLLPYLSPENRQTANAWMQRNVPGLVKPTPVGTIPGQITSQIRNQYLSADRATQASDALRRMQLAAGDKAKNLGPGFTFIQQAIGLLQQFGGGMNRGPGMATNGPMNRREYTQFANAVSSLIKDASNERGMGEYVQLATMFLRPDFSAGQLMPGQQVGGRYLYGQANTRFFA